MPLLTRMLHMISRWSAWKTPDCRLFSHCMKLIHGSNCKGSIIYNMTKLYIKLLTQKLTALY